MTDGRRSPQSALFKAASEPDLTMLPDLFLDYPAVPSPSPLAGMDLQLMTADADAYNISISNDPISIRPSPTGSAPTSPGRSSPTTIPNSSPQHPASSPTRPYPSPENPAVSFSEYVASELARDQTRNDRYGVSFVPASKSSAPVASSPFESSVASVDQLAPEHAHEAPQVLETPRRADFSDIIRSDTDPVFPSSSADLSPVLNDADASLADAVNSGRETDDLTSVKSKQTHDASNPMTHPSNTLPNHESDHMGYTSNLPSGQDAVFQNGSAGRWGKLDCFQLDDRGELSERQLSRAEILQEARETLNQFQPSPKAVGRWLSNTAQSPSAEIRELADVWEPGTVEGRRAAQKVLRDYLRNSLQARDIRQVDPAFIAKPALWVRHSALVVSLEGLRAIILHNKMFLFDPYKERTKQLVFIARQSIRVRPDAENPQPFEFKALEGILIFLAMLLEHEFGRLKPEIDVYLHQLPNELTTKMLEELRLKKQQLNHFHSRANNVKNILENLLDEDEDMANMYLTEKHASRNQCRSSVDHNEVETLLEAYLQVIDEHVNHAVLLNDAIDDTEDLVMIHLDTLRNRLLSVELALSVVSMTFGIGGVIAGMFGMNMQIPMFESSASEVWFFAVVVFILATIIVSSWFILLALRRRGLYSPL